MKFWESPRGRPSLPSVSPILYSKIMDKFVIRLMSKESHVDKGSVVGPSAKKSRHSESSASTSTGKTKSYKDNLRFNKLLYTKWPWMEYCHQTTDSGMICKICRVYGKPPPQA